MEIFNRMRSVSFAKRTKQQYLWLVGALFRLANSVSGRTLQDTAGMSQSLPNVSPESPSSSSTLMSTSSSSSSASHAWIYVVGFGSALFLIVTISVVAVLYLRLKRRFTAVSPWKQGMSGQLQRDLDTAVPLLKRQEVESACEDFSNIIGSSSDSVVYKGTLSNGQEIAATSIRVAATNWTPNCELSFRRKVEALARMKHPHLVNLVGYCSEVDPFTRILVFEYAGNGTLYDHLHNKESEHLDWATRMRIVMGAAYGLTYMHHELVPPASHLNFDASSVYLTDDYAAKVANFGVTKTPLARQERQKSGWLTQRSSIGYDDIEGSDRHSPDFESNMYSFGVFLLEVITGRQPQSEQTGSLVDWANEYISDPKMVWYMVDPKLKNYNHDDLVTLCKIVTMCLASRNRRPSMRKVTSMLAEVLKMSAESVGPKSTALLWAQLELQDDDSSEP